MWKRLTNITRASRWRRRLIVYGGIYLVALPFMIFGGCADRLILIPQTADHSGAGAQRRAIAFDGGELEIWIASPYGSAGREPAAFVLVFTGNADRAEDAALAESWFWRDHPVEVWAMNYPGYGESTGPPRLSRCAAAGLLAYDDLRRTAGPRPIYISGTSLGGTVALHVAASREVHGLLLHNPPPLRQLIRGRYGWWNLWLLAGPISFGVPAELDSITNAGSTTAPAVFILSTDDRIVPPRYQQMVATAYAGPTRTIETPGGHNDPLTPQSEQAIQHAIHWLRAHPAP